MKVVVELSEKEVKRLEEAIGFDIEDEDDVVDSIHTLIENCM